MKKRTICLLLSAIMVLLCFAGCAEKTGAEIKAEIGEKASEGAVTISMYLMSEEPVSAAQEKLMETKVNEITESKFKIRLDLRYFTPDEYYTKLEADLAQMQSFYGSGTALKDKGTPVYTDANGLPAVYYPRIEEFDVDIFYFSGYEKYSEYKDNNFLSSLAEEVSGASKALKREINSTLFNNFSTLAGGLNAIPTNRAIGEYTYLLLNKEALEDTHHEASDFTSVTDETARDMLEQIKTVFADKYVPLYSETDDIGLLNVKSFGLDADGNFTDDFSLISGTYDTNWTGGLYEYPLFKNALKAENHRLNADLLSGLEQFRVLKGYEYSGYYADETNADKPFALGYIKGGPEVVEQYADEYEIVTLANPMLTRNEVFESMFAVSSYTNSLSASAKIITYLNTDADFRNLILYGVEGENYSWVDSDVLDANGTPYRVVKRQTKDADKLYVMDAVKTGNVAIAYPEFGQYPLANERISEQNEDMVIDPILSFSLYDGVKSGKVSKASLNALVRVSQLSRDAYADLMSAKTVEEFNKILEELDKKLETSNDLQLITNEGISTSPAAYYKAWLRSMSLHPLLG